MEVLFISHKYPPATGGMEKFSYELVNRIKKYAKVHTIIYEGTERKITWFYKLKNRVEVMLKSNPNISLIHLNDGLMIAFSLWLKKKYNLPVVGTLHGLDIVFPLPFFQKKIVPKFNILDGFACVSEATKNAAVKRGIDPSKIVVINNGVGHDISVVKDNGDVQKSLLEKYNIIPDKKILIGLGRSVKRKGFSWFVTNVLPKLGDDIVLIQCGPNANYNGNKLKRFLPNKFVHYIELMLGLPSDDAELQILSKDIKNKYVKTGYLPFSEVLQLLRLAPIFIMPNIKIEGDMEGFGLVALEASMSNCIVLASKTDGITNAIIDNKNGYLIEPENIEAWVSKINEILNLSNRDFVAEEFKNYTLDNYSWDKMCKEYYEWFLKF